MWKKGESSDISVKESVKFNFGKFSVRPWLIEWAP